MRFKKLLMFGYSGNERDKKYWDKIDQLCETRVVATNSLELSKHFDADALIVKFAEVVDKRLIDKMPNLKYIGTLATAYGRIDTKYAASKNISVCNVPGYSTIAVAEFAIGIILENIREIERGKRQAGEGNYSEAGFQASEMNGKTFGIIGLGSIGSKIAEIASSFGANVIYWSITRKKKYEERGIKYKELDCPP
jgi:lactate dehydrogenase-like 2-hydroxyacid dehydrogenase